MPTPPLVFTTDFGLSDPYAGVMKGVALSINPDAHLIDHTHQISPQNVAQGSFLLGLNHRFFPEDAIHVAVVDPGVGTARRPVLLTTPWGRFVGPDNGLLSGVLKRYLDSPPSTSGLAKTPPEITAVHLTNREYWRQPLSQTFHGRDIFTPVAAHLSSGIAPEAFGDTLDDLFYLPMSLPRQQEGVITGQVIYQDAYGNLVTNIPARSLPASSQIEVRIEDQRISGLSRTFNDPRHGEARLIALVGSHGYLEVAVPNGSAARLLEIDQAWGVQVVVVSG